MNYITIEQKNQCRSKKCGRELPSGAVYCPFCGTKQDGNIRSPKKRGNGQGTVYRLSNGKYRATVTLGYYVDDDLKLHRRTRSETFTKKSDAVAALPGLRTRRPEKESITFAKLYERWLPTHRAGADTINCYKAAFKHLRPVWPLRMDEIDIDDLQDCLDSCGRGKRTQQNMKTLVGLVYKFGIPRKVVPDNLNLSPFLIVGGEDAAHRDAFTDVQIEQIKRAVGRVPYADYILCMIYLGFRPSEFLALRKEDYFGDYFIGGAKTDAGKGRIVTISPKIRPLVASTARRGTDIFFADESGCAWTLKAFTEDAFYPALKAAGIDNPIVEIAGGVKRHKYTPHSCRHTFATLMKRIEAPAIDKQELIGHSSEEQLRYYQDVTVEDLKKITDVI